MSDPHTNTVSITYQFETDDQSRAFLNHLGEFLATITVVKFDELTIERGPLPDIKDVRRVELKPDDVLIVSCAVPVTSDTADDIRRHVNAIWPDHRVLVFSKDWDLEIIRVIENGREVGK